MPPYSKSRIMIPKLGTISSIKSQIKGGNLLQARDRLHGLLANDNDNMEIRALLGDVYSKLGEEKKAGAMWYLTPLPHDTKVLKAIETFERSYHKDPLKKWRALIIQQQPSTWNDRGARNILTKLESDLKEEDICFSWDSPKKDNCEKKQ